MVSSTQRSLVRLLAQTNAFHKRDGSTVAGINAGKKPVLTEFDEEKIKYEFQRLSSITPALESRRDHDPDFRQA